MVDLRSGLKGAINFRGTSVLFSYVENNIIVQLVQQTFICLTWNSVPNVM